MPSQGLCNVNAVCGAEDEISVDETKLVHVGGVLRCSFYGLL